MGGSDPDERGLRVAEINPYHVLKIPWVEFDVVGVMVGSDSVGGGNGHGAIYNGVDAIC